jgi:hypothetical protein
MTSKRIRFLQELMKFVGMEEGRLRLEWISAAEGPKFAQTVRDFTEQIRKLGPNPLGKGYRRPLEVPELSAIQRAATGSGCAGSCSDASAKA